MFFGKEKTLRAGLPLPIFGRQGGHSGGHISAAALGALPAMATLNSLFELSGFFFVRLNAFLNNFNHLFFFFSF